MSARNACPACGSTDVPQFSEWFTGTVPRTCGACGHTWTTTFRRPDAEAERLPGAAREQLLWSPSRFAEPDPEGRYAYDDEADT